MGGSVGWGTACRCEEKRWYQKRAVAWVPLHSLQMEPMVGLENREDRSLALAWDKPQPLPEVELPHTQGQL